MGNVIQIKRGATAPPDGALAEGELGMNTSTGEVYVGTSSGKAVKISGSEGSMTDLSGIEAQLVSIQDAVGERKASEYTIVSVVNSMNGLFDDFNGDLGQVLQQISLIQDKLDALQETVDSLVSSSQQG